MNVWPFGQVYVLIQKFHRMKSRPLLQSLLEIIRSVRNALDTVQRAKSEIHLGVAVTYASRKRTRMEGGGGYLVLDGVSLDSGQVSKEVKRAEKAVALDRSLARILGDLFSEKRLASFVKFVGKRMCLEGIGGLMKMWQ